MIAIDMDMPRSCAECPMFEYAALSNCKLLKVPLMWYEAHESRDERCELIDLEDRYETRTEHNAIHRRVLYL